MINRSECVLIVVMAVLRGIAFCSNAFVVPRRWALTNSRCSHRCSGVASLSNISEHSLDVHPFEECWNVNTWSVNPLNDTRIDAILQRLCSPAPQSLFVIQRAIRQQQSRTIEQALSECTYLLKPGFEFQVQGDAWRIEACQNSGDSSDWRSVIPNDNNMNAVELAHEALDIAIDASENHVPIDEQELNDLAEEAMDRLSLTLGTDIRGRSSADAAFAFAMAGVADEDLYQYLALVARLELERIGQRPSFRSKYILQIVEKLAASGIKDDELYRVAADCLAFKGEHMDIVETLSRPNEFDLLTTRPLLWLWRFSARQRKVASESIGQVEKDFVTQKYDVSTGDWWVRGFDDPSLPLVVDVGCGMGVSLLGLATMDQSSQDSFNSSPEGTLLGDIDWHKCNYLGGDLSQLCLGYGRGIAQWWGISGRLQFTYGSALDLLKSIESHYPGKVSLIMIQFPTPFQLKDAGNRQLPSGLESGFMVSEELLEASKRSLESSHGFLLLQSNCEDVAVTMRDMAEDATGLDCVDVPSCATSVPESDGSSRTPPQRTLDWIQKGGKRAVGDGWSLAPLIPSRGATETEVSCRFNKTPIHRCLLRVRSRTTH